MKPILTIFDNLMVLHSKEVVTEYPVVDLRIPFSCYGVGQKSSPDFPSSKTSSQQNYHLRQTLHLCSNNKTVSLTFQGFAQINCIGRKDLVRGGVQVLFSQQ